MEGIFEINSGPVDIVGLHIEFLGVEFSWLVIRVRNLIQNISSVQLITHVI